MATEQDGRTVSDNSAPTPPGGAAVPENGPAQTDLVGANVDLDTASGISRRRLLTLGEVGPPVWAVGRSSGATRRTPLTPAASP
jgi:hypothetical protein